MCAFAGAFDTCPPPCLRCSADTAAAKSAATAVVTAAVAWHFVCILGKTQSYVVTSTSMYFVLCVLSGGEVSIWPSLHFPKKACRVGFLPFP